MTISRVLVITFAFPPMGVQMAPVAARAVVELAINGFSVDVVSANPNVWPLPADGGLNRYVDRHVDSLVRLESGKDVSSTFRRFLRRMCDIPDPMISVVKPGLVTILNRGRDRYDAILSISPFHSVNLLALEVSKQWPHVPWIAYFCDPWANNPLESRPITRIWNRCLEPRAFMQADLIVQSSQIAARQLEGAYPNLPTAKFRHVHHTFDSWFYPLRERAHNERFTFRFLGTLFGRRSPEPLISGVKALLERRPAMRSEIAIELVGPVEPRLSRHFDSNALSSVLRHQPAVSYLQSLELMYDADALVLIEVDEPDIPFLPSKLTDYLGADTPILGIVPRGECRDVLTALGAPVHYADDAEGIAASMEVMVERRHAERAAWCNQLLRRSFDLRIRQDGLAAIVKESCGV